MTFEELLKAYKELLEWAEEWACDSAQEYPFTKEAEAALDKARAIAGVRK